MTYKPPTIINTNVVHIVCPECETEQQSYENTFEGDPFVTYIHRCGKCNYCIMESEWEKAEANNEQQTIK